MISKFSKLASTVEEKDVWIKELPLLALIHHGILKMVFNYDYAPASVELQVGRVFLNLSQEGIDNIEDLREFGYIDCLKLSSTSHLFLNGYKINQQGINVLNGWELDAKVSESSKQAVDRLIACPSCGHMISVDVDMQFDTREINLDLICGDPNCSFRQPIRMTDIEDVSYKSEPFLPRNIGRE